MTRWHRIPLVLTLIEDVSLSERAATAGGHRALDHVPGRRLLGAAAARLYDELGERSWDAFHAGALRFLDALPLDAKGRRWIPLPKSLARPKGREEPVLVLDHPSFVPDRSQLPEALGGGYLAGIRGDRLELGSVPLVRRFKTAIDPERGNRPRDEMLFDRQALPRGLRLGTALLYRDGERELAERVVDALCARDLLLGGSRHAEYGRTRVERGQWRPSIDPEPSPPDGEGKEFSILLVSDLALNDPRSGRPRLVPRAEDFGLNGRYLPERSLLRSRRYAPFNGHRRAHERERVVIQRGSVLAFKLDEAVDLAALDFSGGVGLHREEGLGEILVAPELLSRSVWEGRASRIEPSWQRSSNQVAPAGEVAALWRWMQESAEEAKALPDDPRHLARLCLRAAGRDTRRALTPSQWSRLAGALRAGGPAVAGVLKPSRPGAEGPWQQRGPDGLSWQEWVLDRLGLPPKTELEELSGRVERRPALALARLAERVRAEMKLLDDEVEHG